MGTHLVEEVMDHAALLGLTLGERWALAVLARNARDATRLTWHHANHPAILRHAGIAPNAWRNVRTALVRKGVLEVVTPGRPGRGGCGAMYRIPELATLVHPADAEAPMADQDGPESRANAHPSGADTGTPIAHLRGAQSGPYTHPSGAQSASSPFFPSSVPPPPVAGAVPTARHGGAERQIREEEVAAANFERYHQRERAFAIMESLKRLPVSRDSGRRGMELCVAIGERLAIGRPEQEIRDCLDAPLVTSEPVYDPIGFLLKRIRRIPVVPPGNVGVRDSGRGIEELQGKLAQEGVELYARQGDRPGVVDTAKIPGGWRSYRTQPEASDGA